MPGSVERRLREVGHQLEAIPDARQVAFSIRCCVGLYPRKEDFRIPPGTDSCPPRHRGVPSWIKALLLFTIHVDPAASISQHTRFAFFEPVHAVCNQVTRIRRFFVECQAYLGSR